MSPDSSVAGGRAGGSSTREVPQAWALPCARLLGPAQAGGVLRLGPRRWQVGTATENVEPFVRRITMKVLALAALMLIPGPGRALPAHGPDSPARFSLIIGQHEHGWSATCEEGCSWRTVAYSCLGDCTVLLDAHGIAARLAEPTPGTGFAFLLTPGESGGTATGVHGTAWVKLGW